ncbi:hypothetical protein CLIM01_12304 [Colletotrichum limetticola]|uniref:Uncharacterized protein n=1 Tax=Colletotrichum limetticola TaxID=1209924 RepID=A0ABQ9PGL7_9PEZI|nr:hypothetical protein CLIM01_12304 [Colletotrichum limetticola]
MHRGSSRIALEDRQPNAEAIQPRRVVQRVVTVRRTGKRNMHHQQPALPHPRTQNIRKSRLTSPAAPCSQLLLAMGKEGRPHHELLQYRLDVWHGSLVMKPNAKPKCHNTLERAKIGFAAHHTPRTGKSTRLDGNIWSCVTNASRC